MEIGEVFSTKYIEYCWKDNYYIQFEQIRAEKEAWIKKIKNKIIFQWGAKSDPAGDEDLIINFILP